jgi:hypothetical protein
VDLALGHAEDREASHPGRPAAAVAHVPADEREADVLGGVQGREGSDAVGRRVVGDEEDWPRVRAQRSASS